MADEKKAGQGIAGITAEAKAIFAEVHDDAVKVGGEVLTLAADVKTAVVETGSAAAAALSSLVETIWAAAKTKFGKAVLLLVVLCLAGQAQAATPVQRGQAAVAIALSGVPAKCDCSGPVDCTCAQGTCTCPGCVVKVDPFADQQAMTDAEASAYLRRTGRSPVSRDGGKTWFVDEQAHPAVQQSYQPSYQPQRYAAPACTS